MDKSLLAGLKLTLTLTELLDKQVAPNRLKPDWQLKQLVTVYWQVTQGATQGWQLRGWKTTLPWVLGALEEAK